MQHELFRGVHCIPLAWFENAPAGFWDLVEIGAPDACWPWSRSLNSAGYGNYRENGLPMLSHLVAFRAAHGEMPEGKECGHSCHYAACNNPGHLKPLTHAENMAEMGARYRGRPRRVLTEAVVRTARELRKLGAKIKDLAEQFGVRAATLGAAIRGATWAWVADEVTECAA